VTRVKINKNDIVPRSEDEIQIPNFNFPGMELANKFLKQKRYVSLTGTISENSAENFISNLLRLEMDDPAKDILVIVNSHGGFIHAAWSMIDAMNLLKCNVHTLSIGKAMSAGALVLMNGTKGKRYSTPHSSIMIHKLRGETYGAIDDMDVDMQETKRMQIEIEDFICSKTKIKSKEISSILGRDCYITPTKALQLGLVDKIINKFNEIKLETQ
jgi:ATP-dependent Clp protease protease subunit